LTSAGKGAVVQAVAKNPKQEQVDRNFEVFKKLLPDLLVENRGRWALMRDGTVVDIFDTAGDAYTSGASRFEDGLFSVQRIGESVDLGFFSHALP